MEPMVLINPRILEQGGEVIKDREGCLSVPGIRGLVPRESYVQVEYQDKDGKREQVEWRGCFSSCILA